MGDVKWIKLTTDMFDNRKIKHLRRLPDGNNIVLLWVMLLTMAGRCNAGGMIYLTEDIPYTTKMLADELGFEENTVVLGIEALDQLNMVVSNNGFYTIAGWEEYQSTDKLAEMREKNRERQKRWYDKQKELPNVRTNVSMTLPNAIEEDKEKDKEKEFLSFNQRGENRQLNRMSGALGKGVVFMSEEQENDLLDKLSIDEFDYYVDVVANCELSGKSFKKKSHYQAILDMVEKDRRVKGAV